MSEFKFESLVPDENIDDRKKIYINALKWAINNPKNKNIAITGSYGAGKSSIINTFEKEANIKEQTVKISIATFEKEAYEKQEENGDKVILENILEQQILQQLFYRISPNKIPLSRFTNLKEIDSYKAMTGIGYFLFILLVTVLLYKIKFIDKSITIFLSGDLMKTILIAILSIAFFIMYIYVIYYLALFIQKLGLTKFGFGNTSIEVVTKDNNTVFNRYLDEIIYLFQQANFKYVIFEDLDRFENIIIYERLKSLNFILNSTEQLKNHNIVFIYALKDDLFINNDASHEIYNRTKFFDFIIPTIKVAHSSNAEGLLMKNLEDEIQNGLTKVTIKELSFYINDMRILKNICNEYRIYKGALNANGVTPDKIFAFVVYKNIYPGDYSELLNSKGKLYELINIKKKAINYYEDKIQAINEQIEDGIFAQNYSADEVEILFYTKKYDKNYHYSMEDEVKINFNGHIFPFKKQNHSQYKLESYPDLLDWCVSNIEEDIVLQFYRNGRFISSSNANEYFTVSGVNYLSKYNSIKNIKSVNLLSKWKILNEKNITKLRNNSLESNIQQGIIKPVLDNNNKDENLMFFLIANGYIDESYEDYLSYFEEGSLSQNDNKFIKLLRNNQDSITTLSLTNIPEIISRVKNEDLSSNAIFNYNFFEYLIKHNETKLELSLRTIFNSEEGIQFYLALTNYLSNTEGSLLSILFSKCIEYEYQILEIFTKTLDKQNLNNYIEILIINLPDVKLLLDEDKQALIKELETTDLKRLINKCGLSLIEIIADKLNLKFEDIQSDKLIRETKLLSDFNFKINLNNLQILFGTINFSTCLTDPLVGKYFETNKNDFIESVILKLDNFNDDQSMVLKQLNDENLKDELKNKLIQKLNFKFEYIEELNSIATVVKYNKFKWTLGNFKTLFKHYKEKKIDLNDLVFDIDNQQSLFDSIYPESGLSSTLIDKILNNILLDPQFEESLFSKLLSSLDNLEIEINKISNNNLGKISLIIDKIILLWDKEVYKGLVDFSEEAQSLAIKYLNNNIIDLEDVEEVHPLKDNIIELIEEELIGWSPDFLKNIYSKVKLDDEHRLLYITNNLSDIPVEILEMGIGKEIPILIDMINYLDIPKVKVRYIIECFDKFSVDEVISKVNFWSYDIFKALIDFDNKTARSYFVRYQDKIDCNELNQSDLEFLLVKELFEQLNVNVVIEVYNQNGMSPFNEFRSWLLTIDLRKYIIKLYNVLEIIKAMNKDENVAKVLLAYIHEKQLSRPEIYQLLSELRVPFNQIKLKNGNGKNFNNGVNMLNLIEYLYDIGLISKYEIKDEVGVIMVNNKRVIK